MKDSNAIDGSIDFIESRLTESIDIGELAQQAFFSKMRYQRLFRAIVGEPVMEYVKNRRLQLACRDVSAGCAGILDIALKYGCDSHCNTSLRLLRSILTTSFSKVGYYRRNSLSNRNASIARRSVGCE